MGTSISFKRPDGQGRQWLSRQRPRRGKRAGRRRDPGMVGAPGADQGVVVTASRWAGFDALAPDLYAGKGGCRITTPTLPGKEMNSLDFMDATHADGFAAPCNIWAGTAPRSA